MVRACSTSPTRRQLRSPNQRAEIYSSACAPCAAGEATCRADDAVRQGQDPRLQAVCDTSRSRKAIA
jgi:hypothetical protein